MGSGGECSPPDNFGPNQLRSDAVAVALGVVTVGTIARMGIFHEVTGHTSRGGLADDFPVTESLNLRLDVADGGSKIPDTKSCLCFISREALAVGKIVHDSTLFGESVVRHYAVSY